MVLAFAMVPDEIDDAFRLVNDEPPPIKSLAVIMSAAKSPLASRRTIVFAPFEADAVVRAFATVPLEILEPLILVTADPSPLNVAVIVPAENSPDAPRATIVLAPLLDEAVVRAFARVPLLMFEAFRLVMFSPLKVAVEDPVPPWATARIPVETLFALMLVILAPEKVAVADPVPPAVIGRVALFGI